MLNCSQLNHFLEFMNLPYSGFEGAHRGVPIIQVLP